MLNNNSEGALKHLQKFSQGNKEPDWFWDLRQLGELLSGRLPLPKPDKTNISNWNFIYDYELPRKTDPCASIDEFSDEIKSTLTDAISDGKLQHNLFVQRNFSSNYEYLTEKTREKGVIFTSIANALEKHGDLVRKYYLKSDLTSMDDHKLLALNVARQNGGLFLYIPENVTVEEPLQAVFSFDSKFKTLYNHVIIVAEKGSRAQYLERYVSENKTGVCNVNVVSEVYVNTDANLQYGAFDSLAEDVVAHMHRAGTVMQGGNLDWSICSANAGKAILENLTLLVGDYSESNLNLVAVGKGNSKQNFTTKIVHDGKGSKGNIEQRGVVYENATVVLNGIGKILNGASGSDAQQTSKVLMLSEGGRADANPILLIEEDDVTAGHAASAGRIDELQMYYLLSRGISKEKAQQLVVQGFLKGILPVTYIQEQMLGFLNK